MPRWLFGLLERARALLARGRFESDLDEELRFHIEQATARGINRGLAPDEAARAARVALGGVEQIKEGVRGETGVRLLQDIGQDLTTAGRGIRRNPGFAASVIVTLAICIAANAAVFAIVYGILLRPLPFPDSGRLVRVFNSYPDAGEPRSGNSVLAFDDRRAHVPALEDVALYAEEASILGRGETARHTFALRVTPSFFKALRANAALGRLLDENGTREVVIGHTLWISAFGARHDVIGTTAVFDGETSTIVGVLPESFRFSTWDAQVFIPLVFSPADRAESRRHADRFQMIARLAPGATIDVAQSQLDAINRARMEGYPAELKAAVAGAGFRTMVRPYLSDMTRDVARPLLFLWAGVLLVFLISAANVTGLFLIRAHARSRELGTRLALGAGRLRVLRQLVVESAVLALAAGGLGLLLARLSLGLLDRFAVYEIPRVDDVSINPLVAGCSIAAVLALAAVAGTLPGVLLTGRRRDGTLGLLQGNRGTIQAGASRLHRLLAVSQIALAFVLVLSAGLLLATLRNLTAVDPGFDAERVAVSAAALPGSRYPDRDARLAFVRRMLDAIVAVPGVRSAAVASHLPFSGESSRNAVAAGQIAHAPADGVALPYQTVVTPGYFETLGIALTEGRTFLESDDTSSRRVAVIDETLARRHWGRDSPVGRRLWLGATAGADDEALTIVGVVEPIRHESLRNESAAGAVYLPLAQASLGFFRIAAKLDADRSTVWPGVRGAIGALDPGLVLFWNDTLDASVDDTLLLQRTPMQLLSAFAGLALFLGAVGIYGVVAYAVASRGREIGLRLALGSSRAGILRLVAREWSAIVGLGIVAGLLGAMLAGRALAGLLYGTGALDAAVISATAGIIAATAAAACALPVRRALQIDPAVALKGD